MSQRNINPYSSGNNIGFGARATTGGTYENPRLGIEDMTAFGRGVASTFRLPKEEEKKNLLSIPDVLIGSQRGNEWFENKNGDINDLNQNFGNILNNQWKNDMNEGGAGYYYNMYKNAKDGSPEQAFALNAIKEYEKVLGPNGFLSNYLNTIGDGTKVDKAASNIFLPGLDGSNTQFTLGDISADSQNNPQNWKYAQKRDKFGQLRTGLVHNPTGEFIDVSAMDDAWVDSNIAEFYDFENSILGKYDVVKNLNFKQIDTSNGIITKRNGNEFKVTSDSRYYDDMDFYNFESTVAANTRQEVSNMVSNGTFKSSFRQVYDLVKSGEFRLDDNILNAYYSIEEQASQNKQNGIGDENGYTPELIDAYSTFEKAAVTDYYNEQFKLRNGSDYYAKDTRLVLTDEDGNYNMGDNSMYKVVKKGDEQIVEVNENFDPNKTDTTPYNLNFGRSIQRSAENVEFFEGDFSDVQLRKQKSMNINIGRGGGDSFDSTGYASDFYTDLNNAINDDVAGRKRAGDLNPFEDFFTSYGIPEENVLSVQYKAVPVEGGDLDADDDTIATNITGLGTLTVQWDRKVTLNKSDMSTTTTLMEPFSVSYDLTKKLSIRKLVNDMIKYSPELQGTSSDAKKMRAALLKNYTLLAEMATAN